jgi:signal transduction histidine kinase
MPDVRASRARLLWVGGSILTIAVALLTIIQYRLLSRLRNASLESRTRQAELLADEISTGIAQYFGIHADASLDVTREELYDSAAVIARLRKNDFQGAREFFVARFDPAGRMSVLHYDRANARLVERPEAKSMPAIEFALYAWSSPERRRILRRPQRLAGLPPRTTNQATNINLDLSNADRGNRTAVHPVGIGDEFAGAVGFIIDDHYVRRVLVPSLIERTRRDPKWSGLSVAVRETGTGVIEGSAPSANQRPLARLPLGFALRDNVLEIYGDGTTAAALASRSFVLNLGLMIFIAVNAVAGAILTIRSARTQMRLASMKNDFISNVTHELRTPLSSIRLFARLIRTGGQATHAEAVTYAGHIEEESERLSRMVEHVLALSRLEGHAGEPFTTFDLRSAVRAALARHSGLLRSRRLELQSHLPGAPLFVAGNAESLTSAISNVIENAIHYSHEDEGAIELELRAEAGGAEITVRDRGIGIAASDRERIFERFFRGEDEMVRRVNGSGLGLAIVRTAVEAHGGQVTVAGRHGGGSAFTIRLPAARVRTGTG